MNRTKCTAETKVILMVVCTNHDGIVTKTIQSELFTAFSIPELTLG